MQTHFRKRLAEVRLRWNIDRLLRQLADAALGVAVVALAAVLAEKSLAVRVIAPLATGIFLGAAALAVAAWWFFTRPSAMQVALAIDERIALRERFSTALALAKSTDPFAVAAREETYQRAEHLDVGRHFPIRPTWRWAHASAAWAAVVALAVLMPSLDLLGHRAAAEKLAREKQAAEQAKAEVAKAVGRVEAMAKQLNDPALAAELAKLQTFEVQANPQEIRRQSIRSLGDVAKRIEEMRQGDQAQAAKALQEMMKQMHAPGEGLSKDLAQALAKGQFDKAAELAKDLRDKLNKGDLSEKDREALSKRLANLARQLDQIADDRKALEEALESFGCDKSMAGLGEKELREALEKAGLSQEAIDKLLEKARACNAAGRMCKNLGKALGRCAGIGTGEMLSLEDLAVLTGELAKLDELGDRVALMEAMLSDLEGQMAMLGMDPSLMGAKGLFDTGPSDMAGVGSGGPGKGSGPVDTDKTGTTGNKATRVANTSKSGPIIATWTTREEQIKGQATRQSADVVQAAKDAAAEAVSENRIPSRYHESVKNYFDSLGQGEKDK